MPNAVTVAVFFVTSNDRAAGGCPRSPGIDNVTSTVSALSSQIHPSSSTDGRREVDSVPLVVTANSSRGRGASRSSRVRPRSETSIVPSKRGVMVLLLRLVVGEGIGC